VELTPAGERAIALFRQGRAAEALQLLDQALARNPADIYTLIMKGRLLQAMRRLDQALACFESALGAEPGLAELWNERGALLSDMGRHDAALESYDRAVAARPDIAEVFYNRGNTLRDLKREEEALASYDRAIALRADFFQAWNNRGSALLTLKLNAEAVANFDHVLAIHPGVAETWNNRGIALAALNRPDEALESCERALGLEAKFARAWDNRGTLLRQAGRADEALASHDRALALDPSLDEAWFNRGNVLRDQRRLKDALQSFDQALQIKSDNPHAWLNRGIVLRDSKRIADAMTSYSKALEIDPDYIEALYSRGICAWVENQDYELARRDLERAVRLDPDCGYALGGLLLVKQYGADWDDFARDVARIDQGVRAGKEVAEPFLYQAVSQSPADLQSCSTIHARNRYPEQPQLKPAHPARRQGKIRIGYVSGEFREQATAYLMAGVYECHDKSRFEITAFDNGWNDGSAVRKRLEAAFDRILPIAHLSDRDAARAIAGLEVDILVNLNGYFGDHRMGVFAHRPAPIQVNYLGFPATLGAPYIDYIIADRIVIPENERQFYTEQVVWLPESYQANDSSRAIADDTPTRQSCGLPGDSFVFCNFNAGYKLTPDTFARWLRIMNQVPGSVLWLLEGLPQFADNLRRHAEAAGIAGGRLVFAQGLKLAPHLARLSLADLFLDGLPYNAHTTASDALWAGVPLITCRGTAFPGRVAASLLNAVGLPELITENSADYEALGVKLAAEPALIQSIRHKLAMQRASTALFDTARFTRHLETAYETMQAGRGRQATTFAVTP
jgi:predicted O-linked N-acetylglucosamine transferase (SPINDLY family)